MIIKIKIIKVELKVENRKSYYTLFVMIIFVVIMTWIRRIWSQRHLWWRSQWGAPWCLRWDSAGPQSWSSCLSPPRQRLQCQSRFAPTEGWIQQALSLQKEHKEQCLSVEIINKQRQSGIKPKVGCRASGLRPADLTFGWSHRIFVHLRLHWT